LSLKRNFLVGLFGSVWSALLSLAVVPLYLKYLGTEAFGLIGFFVTTQALLQLLDLGLSPTINREVARGHATGEMRDASNLLHTLSVVYWFMAAVIAVIVLTLSPVIAGSWLQTRQLTQETVTHAVMLIGLVVACRWPVGLYMGAMMGMQKVALASALNTAMSTLSSLGAVVVLVYVSPTIEAFFIWQACVGLAYAAFMHWKAWSLMPHTGEPTRFQTVDLQRIWRFSAGMSALTITGIVLVQSDKVLLSRLLSLEDFGRYTLAAMLANSLYILLTPLFNAIYPRMTALVAAGETEKLADLYNTGTRVFLSLLFPLAITGALYSEDLLYLWTRDQTLAATTSMLATYLLLGTMLNGVMHFPYALQLAYGSTSVPLIITTSLIIAYVPLVIILTTLYGKTGGASAWLVLNTAYLIFGTWVTHRHFLKGKGMGWLLGNVGIPFAVTLVIVMVGKELTHEDGHMYKALVWGTVFFLTAVGANLLLLPGSTLAKLKQWRTLRPAVVQV